MSVPLMNDEQKKRCVYRHIRPCTIASDVNHTNRAIWCHEGWVPHLMVEPNRICISTDSNRSPGIDRPYPVSDIARLIISGQPGVYVSRYDQLSAFVRWPQILTKQVDTYCAKNVAYETKCMHVTHQWVAVGDSHPLISHQTLTNRIEACTCTIE